MVCYCILLVLVLESIVILSFFFSLPLMLLSAIGGKMGFYYKEHEILPPLPGTFWAKARHLCPISPAEFPPILGWFSPHTMLALKIEMHFTNLFFNLVPYPI